METVVQVIKQVRDELCMPLNSEILQGDDDKYLCSDGCTFILASRKQKDIRKWAQMHKLLNNVAWNKQIYNIEPTDHDKVMNSTLKLVSRCHREPEIDIILDKMYGDISVVVYTDSTYEIILEGMQIEGKNIDEIT